MKVIILYIFKALGLFALSRFFIANKTLILAYHGFEIWDETSHLPNMFIKKSTFKQRLAYLKKHCHIIGIDELEYHGPEDNKVVITIDDGWYSTLAIAAPELKQLNMPFTVYLTTEDVLDNNPVYNLTIQYILYKHLGCRLTFQSQYQPSVNLDVIITINNIEEIIAQLTRAKSYKNDIELLTKIAEALDFNLSEIIDNRMLSIMSPAQVRQIESLGADIQLHTHTHYTPLDSFAKFAEEIRINRYHIKKITHKVPQHHCYPSGSYNYKCINYLKHLDIKTATTCEAGFCDHTTNPRALPRFLDSENVPQIVFEAEVCGILELLRKVRKCWHHSIELIHHHISQHVHWYSSSKDKARH